jgi:hypothetical protein
MASWASLSTFLDKYNPDQFEIVGTLESSDPDNPYRTRWYSAQDQKDAYLPSVRQARKFSA